MRCYICNKKDAEYIDERDNAPLCDQCKSEIDEVVYSWEQEEDISWRHTKNAHPVDTGGVTQSSRMVEDTATPAGTPRELK